MSNGVGVGAREEAAAPGPGEVSGAAEAPGGEGAQAAGGEGREDGKPREALGATPH